MYYQQPSRPTVESLAAGQKSAVPAIVDGKCVEVIVIKATPLAAERTRLQPMPMEICDTLRETSKVIAATTPAPPPMPPAAVEPNEPK